MSRNRRRGKPGTNTFTNNAAVASIRPITLIEFLELLQKSLRLLEDTNISDSCPFSYIFRDSRTFTLISDFHVYRFPTEIAQETINQLGSRDEGFRKLGQLVLLKELEFLTKHIINHE